MTCQPDEADLDSLTDEELAERRSLAGDPLV